jgi:hypothetical protein
MGMEAESSGELAQHYQVIRWSPTDDVQELAATLNTYYRNANLRVAVRLREGLRVGLLLGKLEPDVSQRTAHRLVELLGGDIERRFHRTRFKRLDTVRLLLAQLVRVCSTRRALSRAREDSNRVIRSGSGSSPWRLIGPIAPSTCAQDHLAAEHVPPARRHATRPL